MANLLPENTEYTGGFDFSKVSGAINKAIQNRGKMTNVTLPQPYSKASAESIKPVQFQAGQPLATPTKDKDVPVPEDYSGFWSTDTQSKTGEPRWTAPTESTVIRNWPSDLGGGQYAYDPTQPGALIKSNRAPSTEIRKKVIGGIPAFNEVDHIIPLWVGGADTAENKEILTNLEHDKKTRAQAVPLTLLSSGKISLPEAKSLALSWKTRDTSNIPSLSKEGYLDVTTADNILKQWREDEKGMPEGYAGHSISDTVKSVWKEIPETIASGKFLPFLPDAPSAGKEFTKGVATGVSFLPYYAQEGASGKEAMAGYAGYFLGSLVNMAAAAPRIIKGVGSIASSNAVKNILSKVGLSKGALQIDQKILEKVSPTVLKNLGFADDIIKETATAIGTKSPLINKAVKLGASGLTQSELASVMKVAATARQSAVTSKLANMMIAGGIYGTVKNPYQEINNIIDGQTLGETAARFLTNSIDYGTAWVLPPGMTSAAVDMGLGTSISLMRGDKAADALMNGATMAAFDIIGMIPGIKLPETLGGGILSRKQENLLASLKAGGETTTFTEAKNMLITEASHAAHDRLSSITNLVQKPAKTAAEFEALKNKQYTPEEIQAIKEAVVDTRMKEAIAGKYGDDFYQELSETMRGDVEAVNMLELNGRTPEEIFKVMQDKHLQLVNEAIKGYDVGANETINGVTEAREMLKTNAKLPQVPQRQITPKKTTDTLSKEDMVNIRAKEGFATDKDIAAMKKLNDGIDNEIGWVATTGFHETAASAKLTENLKRVEDAARGVGDWEPVNRQYPGGPGEFYIMDLSDDLKGWMGALARVKESEGVTLDNNNLLVVYTRLRNKLTGQEENIFAGYVATPSRTNKFNADIAKTAKKNEASNFQKYNLTNADLAKNMNALEIPAITAYVEPQAKGLFTTVDGFLHIKLKVTDQNWADGQALKSAGVRRTINKGLQGARIKEEGAKKINEIKTQTEMKQPKPTIKGEREMVVKKPEAAPAIKTGEIKQGEPAQQELPGISKPRKPTDQEKAVKAAGGDKIIKAIKGQDSLSDKITTAAKEVGRAEAPKETPKTETVVMGKEERRINYPDGSYQDVPAKIDNNTILFGGKKYSVGDEVSVMVTGDYGVDVGAGAVITKINPDGTLHIESKGYRDPDVFDRENTSEYAPFVDDVHPDDLYGHYPKTTEVKKPETERTFDQRFKEKWGDTKKEGWGRQSVEDAKIRKEEGRGDTLDEDRLPTLTPEEMAGKKITGETKTPEPKKEYPKNRSKMTAAEIRAEKVAQAKETKTKDRETFKKLQDEIEAINQATLIEGRPLTFEERKTIDSLGKQISALVKKNKPATATISIPPTLKNKNRAKSLYEEYVTKGIDELEDFKTKSAGSVEKTEEMLRQKVRGIVESIPTEKMGQDERAAVKNAVRERLLLESKDIAKAAGTEEMPEYPVTRDILEESEMKRELYLAREAGDKTRAREMEEALGYEPGQVISKKQEIQKVPVLKPSKVLGERYGLKMNDDGYIFFDREGKPKLEKTYKFVGEDGKPGATLDVEEMLTREYGEKTGKLLYKDILLHNKSFSAENFKKGLTAAKNKSTDPAFKALWSAIDFGLEKIFGSKYGERKDFNKIVNETNQYSWLKDMFKTLNPQGHPMSEKKDLIAARLTGDKKKIAEEGEAVRKIRGESEITDRSAREDLFPGEAQEALSLGMREEKPEQYENFVRDLTGMQRELPILFTEELGLGKATPEQGINSAERVLKSISVALAANKKAKGKKVQFKDVEKIMEEFRNLNNQNPKAKIPSSAPKNPPQIKLNELEDKKRLAKEIYRSDPEGLDANEYAILEKNNPKKLDEMYKKLESLWKEADKKGYDSLELEKYMPTGE